MRRLFIVFAAIALAPFPVAAAPETFAEQVVPPVPDYAKVESWAARPGREGAASAVAPGAKPAARMLDVDVFYVHPTTYRSMTRWNQDIADVTANGWTDASAIARQASVFNGCCRVFAPRYRQASSRAFAASEGDGAMAYDLAYGDIVRAFEHYLKHDNHGRPFMLAGHSQGGFHIARLIEDMVDGTPIARQMVAAYVIGYNLSVGDFGKSYKMIPACTKPTQTGCVVQWNSVLPTVDLPVTAGLGQQRYIKRYGDDAGKVQLCVNPLTFDLARPIATQITSLGAVPGAPGYGRIRPLKAQAVSARCDNGLLVVDPDPALSLSPLPGGSMHFHDMGLFYADIRANAVHRSQAYFRRR